MEALSLLLWRERELLEVLSYRLELERLLLSADSTKWLSRATAEVHSTLKQIRETELLRAATSDEAAASIGLAPGSSLRAIAEAANLPWDMIMAEHLEVLQGLSGEIREQLAVNRELIAEGYQAAHEGLSIFDELDAVGLIGPDGGSAARV